MNQQSAKNYLPLVQALIEDGVIQVWTGLTWVDIAEVNFSEHAAVCYRRKPKIVEAWLVMDESNKIRGAFSDFAFARSFCDSITDKQQIRIAHVVEKNSII